jgi:hypothetical protein
MTGDAVTTIAGSPAVRTGKSCVLASPQPFPTSRRSSSRPAVAVAHGANLRAALFGLAGGEDPGVDLGTGQFAVLEVGVATAADRNVRLLEWRTNAAH